MRLYHGSTVSGLEVLRPVSRDAQGRPVLFLTDSFPYSLFYLRDREIDFVTCGVGQDGIVRYDEKFPDQLKRMYQGRAGYVYETEGPAQPGRCPWIWLGREEARVTGVRFIPDAYEAIREEMEKGTVSVLFYEELTEEQKRINHAGVCHYLRHFPLNPAQEIFYRQNFPQAWQECGYISAGTDKISLRLRESYGKISKNP